MMWKIFVLLLAVATVIADSLEPFSMRKINNRIVEGKNVTIMKFPYHVSIHYNYELECSGTIISENLVITSASCLFNKSSEQIFIRAGSSHFYTGGSIHKVKGIALHPEYFWGYNQYRSDIALIKMMDSFKFDKTRQPISICNSEERNPNDTVIISGWGGDGSVPHVFLQSKELEIIPKEECANVYNRGVFDEETQLCVDHPAACASDNGGPLVINECLAGIISVYNDCRIMRPDIPSMHMEVDAFCPWIKKLSGLDIGCKNSTENSSDNTTEYYLTELILNDNYSTF